MISVVAAFVVLAISVDPSGLKKALESADEAEIVSLETDSSKTVNGDNLKSLSQLVDCEERVELVPKSSPPFGSRDIFVLRVRKSGLTETFIVLGNGQLSFNDGGVGKVVRQKNRK